MLSLAGGTYRNSLKINKPIYMTIDIILIYHMIAILNLSSCFLFGGKKTVTASGIPIDFFC